MPTRSLILLAVFASCGCGSKAPEPPQAAPAAANETSELGAWFGSGPEFPDGALCIIFCEGDRLYLGDSPCERTDRGDFQKYIPYQRHGDVISLQWRKVPQFMFRRTQLEHAEVTVAGFQNLRMVRVDDAPAWCANQGTRQMEFDDR